MAMEPKGGRVRGKVLFNKRFSHICSSREMAVANVSAAQLEERVWGEYHENHHGSKKTVIGQRGQQLKVQVHRDDQSLHPGRLHGASLATAMQRPCRLLLERSEWKKLLDTECDTHTHSAALRRSGIKT